MLAFFRSPAKRAAYGVGCVGGIIAVLVGVAFLLPSKEKVDIKARLLGAGAVLGGLIFISDSLWK